LTETTPAYGELVVFGSILLVELSGGSPVALPPARIGVKEDKEAAERVGAQNAHITRTIPLDMCGPCVEERTVSRYLGRLLDF
jgi:hypothetical protein